MDKFIELVKERPFLYDSKNAEFKDRDKKLNGWNEIADKMGSENGTHWRFKWNRLKENYSKYKKINGKPPNLIYRKYKNWPWAECMRFTDNLDNRRSLKKEKPCEKKENTSNITNDNAYITNVMTVSENELFDEDKHKTEGQPNFSEELQEFLYITGDNENEIKNQIYFVEEECIEENSCSNEDVRVIVQNDKTYSPKRKKMKISQPENNHVCQSNNNKRNQFDEVEHFFISYAQTFKRLPTRLQHSLKLEMVTLFARYELMEDHMK